MRISVIGMVWYNEADYPAILRIMEDASNLPATFTEWKKAAEFGENRIRVQGDVAVVRAIINPKEFPAWCAARGLKVNAEGRTAFANYVAFESQKQ